VNRKDFQELADVRISEAELLLAGGHPDGAYYLAGYAIECALKACIARRTAEYDFPPSPESVRNCYTHDIEKLTRSAGLVDQRKAARDANLDLAANWSIVGEWSESSRYERKTETDARDLFNAITDPTNGVLPWIKLHW
jgi:HEPN domain-containing protein